MEGASFTTYIQDGDDGKIVSLSKVNLEGIIPAGVDPKIKKQIEKRKLSKAIELCNKESDINPQIGASVC
jgi:hypothetical protein